MIEFFHNPLYIHSEEAAIARILHVSCVAVSLFPCGNGCLCDSCVLNYIRLRGDTSPLSKQPALPETWLNWRWSVCSKTSVVNKAVKFVSLNLNIKSIGLVPADWLEVSYRNKQNLVKTSRRSETNLTHGFEKKKSLCFSL